MSFWKCSRRKLFAIPSAGSSNTSRSKKRPLFDEENNGSSQSLLIDVADIKEDLRYVKDSIEDIFKITSLQKLPPGLQYLLSESLQCKICHGITKPPVIITKCCKTILGCATCSDMWYRGEDALIKHCPACRSERGYNETMVLKGLDDLLIKLRGLWESDGNESD